MNDAELCGRVLRVNFARPQKFKEGSQKPIWTEENYHQTFLNLNTNEKKQFA
jgi:peptidyl-prolyl isomerase E (cyclophilin E)